MFIYFNFCAHLICDSSSLTSRENFLILFQNDLVNFRLDDVRNENLLSDKSKPSATLAQRKISSLKHTFYIFLFLVG